MRRCVFVKDTLRSFPIGANQSTRCGGQPNERLANRTQKSALGWYGRVSSSYEQT